MTGDTLKIEIADELGTSKVSIWFWMSQMLADIMDIIVYPYGTMW